MKNLISVMAIVALLAMTACSSNSKSKTWSADEEKQWKIECIRVLVDNGVPEADAKDFCDCMYLKTSERYTPKEAAALTVEQERNIWKECDYSW